MYVNDPTELMLEAHLKSDIEVEEPRDYHEFFWDDRPMPGNNWVDRQVGAHLETTCVFDGLNNHVYMSDNCPHYDVEDQEGKTVRKGWTVQSG